MSKARELLDKVVNEKIIHKGLEALIALDLSKLVKKIGEQDTINLISSLISRDARANDNFVYDMLTKYNLI
jgi:hypothetical protein